MNAAETTFTPPAELAAHKSKALIAGGIGLALCALGFVFDRGHFFRSWLAAYLLFLGISLGSMAMVMIQHLSGGVWGVFRRVFEASSRTLPLLVVLFIPIVVGVPYLYPWAHADLVASDAILNHRAEYYLNYPFWIARVVVYFAGWLTLSMVLNKLSRTQDSGDLDVNMRIQRVSGAGLVFYALTVTFAGIDWIMALSPHFYSTLWGFLIMGGQGLAALAFTIVISRYLVGHEPMARLLKPSHFHDLGKLMFAFIMLYAYFNFSQYLLIYAANLVEEVPYMLTRIHNGWQYLAIFLALFHFGAPWLVLLSRNLKRTPHKLVVVALWMLFMRYVDLQMMISPEFLPSGQNMHFVHGEVQSSLFVHWTDLAAPLAIGGLWLWAFFTQLQQRPLFAFGDPYLRESLQSSGGH